MYLRIKNLLSRHSFSILLTLDVTDVMTISFQVKISEIERDYVLQLSYDFLNADFVRKVEIVKRRTGVLCLYDIILSDK